jgi:hypothetical protein
LEKAAPATPRAQLSVFQLQPAKKPYYNPGTLEEGPKVVKGKLN